MLDVVEILCELIRRPSVNPMGRDVLGPTLGERRVTDFLAGLFEQIGLPYYRQEVLPARENIVARLDGDPLPERGGSILVFDIHQDTVPVEGMTIRPFEPQVLDGRVYGRGACDVKGGMAAVLVAVARLAIEPPDARPNIVVSCTVNEEQGFTGSGALRQLWSSGQCRLLPREPDGVVVLEPTRLSVVTTHKGVLRWRCRTDGRAAHSAHPEHGENAIYAMGHVVAALERYADAVVPTLASHRLLSRPTLSVGTITGGVSVNTVPDACTIEIDRRLLPEESPEAAYRHAIDYLAGQLPKEIAPTHEAPVLAASGLSDRNNGPLAERLAGAIRSIGRTPKTEGVAYCTDAAELAVDGTACVVFGPGSIDQAHTADEWIAVEQLHQAVEILYRLAHAR